MKKEMNNFINYYKVLNINRDSSPDTIKRAYREMILKWHPDRNKSPNAHEQSILIAQAYDVLSDEYKKRIYDKVLDSYSRPAYKHSSDESFRKHDSEEQVRRWAKEARKKAESMLHKSFDEFDKWWEGNSTSKVFVLSAIDNTKAIINKSVKVAPKVLEKTFRMTAPIAETGLNYLKITFQIIGRIVLFLVGCSIYFNDISKDIGIVLILIGLLWCFNINNEVSEYITLLVFILLCVSPFIVIFGSVLFYLVIGIFLIVCFGMLLLSDN